MLKAVNGYNTPLQQLLLLEERVRRAGVALPEDAAMQDRFHGIKCRINGQYCMLDIRDVAEVIETRMVTPIPGSRRWIEGVMNYRGQLVPVFNLNVYFNGQEKPAPARNITSGALVVCNAGQEKQALRVDAVSGMQKFYLKDFIAAPRTDDATALEHYFNASVDSGDVRWQRIDLRRLLADMTCQQPLERQAITG